MTLADYMTRWNKQMIAFDLALGTGALLAPRQTLKVLGHEEPSPDAEALFRRCGPIWLTFAAAHITAAARGRSEDWWALAWLRGHAKAGRLVLLGDPGRNYFSAQGLEELARYEIPTSLQLENRGMRETVVWRVLPHP
jgi:hypothetical protein